MNNQHHNSHFFDGFILGIIIGAAAVFLMGTKSGKNLLKIISEQGIDGIANLMEEYNLDASEDDLEEEMEEPVKHAHKESVENTESKVEDMEETKTEAPKKRFFKRFKK